MSLIYMHTCKVTGKSYIGKTKFSMEERWSKHVYSAFTQNSQFHFHRALRKYGKEAWTHEVLAVDIDESEINKYEVNFIEKYDTFNNGYNMTAGGDGGTISEEVRRKLSQSAIERGARGTDSGTFCPWYMVSPTGVETCFYNITKKDYAISVGIDPQDFLRNFRKRAIDRVLVKGPYKGWKFGNIPNLRFEGKEEVIDADVV